MKRGPKPPRLGVTKSSRTGKVARRNREKSSAFLTLTQIDSTPGLKARHSAVVRRGARSHRGRGGGKNKKVLSQDVLAGSYGFEEWQCRIKGTGAGISIGFPYRMCIGYFV